MSNTRAFLILAMIVVLGCSDSSLMAQPVGPSAPPNSDPVRLRSIVETEARKAGTQAVQFGMWVDDREILTMALGNSMTTVPATTSMHYRIGGATLFFQSTLLMMLVEQGRLSLDDKLVRWFPDLLAADQVTVRMLVANTAGYPDYVRREDFQDAVLAEPFRTFKDEELIDYAVKDGQMAYPPGTSQAYSHTEYVILGQVIERATGQSQKELYQQNILGPLGLKDTQYPLDQSIQEPVLHAYSLDRKVYEDSTYWNPSWASSTGGLTSNIHDLGKWGPVFGKGRLISPEHFQEQIGPSSVGKGRNRPDLYFAYGFINSNGWLLQNPNMNGYSGAFAYNLSTGVTLVVAATKNENPSIDPAAIHILREVIAYVTPGSPLNF
ncbi:MAG: hypothetical protein AMXMBFR33_73630 [Candidatus Xenobia bacterium]